MSLHLQYKPGMHDIYALLLPVLLCDPKWPFRDAVLPHLETGSPSNHTRSAWEGEGPSHYYEC